MSVPPSGFTAVTPDFAIHRPATWAFKVTITLLAPEGDANVIMSSEQIELDMGSLEFAQKIGETLRTDMPRYDEESFTAVKLTSGQTAYLRRFSWIPDQGEPVTQMQLYLAGAGRGITSTATASSRDFLRREQQLVEIFAEIYVG